ncbi:MAG: hypothetical protein BroJett018_52840 [Chloroflexota bacterium]|nr:MAG: hypothetical protein BroJett018_52840 [Chloroflexota bacterium]
MRGAAQRSYLPFANEIEQAYTVNVIDTPERRQPAGVVVLARVIGDYVVIEEDLTDRPLVDRLVAAGIPREKIILAYAGEPLPDMT